MRSPAEARKRRRRRTRRAGARRGVTPRRGASLREKVPATDCLGARSHVHEVHDLGGVAFTQTTDVIRRPACCSCRSPLRPGRLEFGSRGAPRRGDRLAPLRAMSAARIWWPPLSEGSSPGDVSEAAALVLVVQEFVANGGGRPWSAPPQCCIAGADGQSWPCRSAWLVAFQRGCLARGVGDFCSTL